LRLQIFSDIHNDWPALERLLSVDADYYIAAGDQLTWSRGMEQCGEILQSRGDRVYVLPGNHESAGQVAAMCARYRLHDFHARHIQVGKWNVAGLGYSNPTPFNTPGESSEPELAERLRRFRELEPLVLICHAPPYGTALDEIRPGVHAGSRSVAEFLNRHQPGYFFCGHIHEAAGVEIRLGATLARNVGKAGYLLELE
jgi:uncharacterized protein